MRAEYPQLEGAEGLVALSYGDGNLYPYDEQDQRSRVLGSLGTEIPEEITELAGDSFYATISPERYELLGRDVLVWVTQGEGVRSVPARPRRPALT